MNRVTLPTNTVDKHVVVVMVVAVAVVKIYIDETLVDNKLTSLLL